MDGTGLGWVGVTWGRRGLLSSWDLATAVRCPRHTAFFCRPQVGEEGRQRACPFVSALTALIFCTDGFHSAWCSVLSAGAARGAGPSVLLLGGSRAQAAQPGPALQPRWWPAVSWTVPRGHPRAPGGSSELTRAPSEDSASARPQLLLCSPMWLGTAVGWPLGNLRSWLLVTCRLLDNCGLGEIDVRGAGADGGRWEIDLAHKVCEPRTAGHTGAAAGLYPWGGAHGEPLGAECSAREGAAFNQEGEGDVIARSSWEGKETGRSRDSS